MFLQCLKGQSNRSETLAGFGRRRNRIPPGNINVHLREEKIEWLCVSSLVRSSICRWRWRDIVNLVNKAFFTYGGGIFRRNWEFPWFHMSKKENLTQCHFHRHCAIYLGKS